MTSAGPVAIRNAFQLQQEVELHTSRLYLEATPPSTGRSIPVMKLLSSEARNTAADAISSAVPSRPIGIIFRKYSLVPSGDPLEPTWTIGVSVGPGLITLARMPRPANSAVQVRTKDTKAAFVAEYAPYPGKPICQAADPDRMIEAFSASTGSAFCTVKYTPRAFRLKCLSYVSGVESASVTGSTTPAFAKTISTRPLTFRTTS